VPRRRSLISTVEVSHAQRAHRCRHDKAHTLDKGDVRLTVMEEGRPFNYCASCSLVMVDEGIERLQRLKATLMARVRTATMT
jgi:hypothetical protein